MFTFNRNNKFYLFLIALLAYLPTCAFVPVELFLIFIPILFIHYRVNWSFIKQINVKRLGRNEYLIISIVLLAGINRLLNWNYSNEGISGIYSYMYLLPLSYFISKIYFRKEIFKFIIYFVLFEIAIAIIEYSLGISTIFKSLGTYREFDSYQMVYYTRTFGLSGNSSVFGLKIFMSLLLIDYLSFKKWTYTFLKICLFFGIFLTFNRAVMLISFLYFIFQIGKISIQFIKKSKVNYASLILNLLFFLFWFHNPTWFQSQFSRNNTQIKLGRLDNNPDGIKLDLPDIEMSGRREIWEAYLTFINDNLFFGNGSKKYMLGTYHAHNSFLEMISSNGIIISFLMLILIAININRFNYIIIVFFAMLSMGQYFILWGVSLSDIVFFSFLFHNQKDFECLSERK